MSDEKGTVDSLFPKRDNEPRRMTAENSPVSLPTQTHRSVPLGEPTSNANARRGMEQGKAKLDRLIGVASRPMPVTGRTIFKEEGQADENGQAWHYHWFGNDVMRIETAKQQGYEFVKDGDGNNMEMAGQVAMRIPLQDYAERKNHIIREVNPAQERSPQESFEASAARNDVETHNESKSSRGVFSQVSEKEI